MTKVLIIDNYDSFVYNIAQYIGAFGADIIVRRNDIKLKDVMKIKPDKIVLSPGPGHPRDSRVTLEILSSISKKIPTLGVCLGHQAIGEVFGGTVIRAERIIHGKTSSIYHNGKGLFDGLPNPITATRYHSLIINSKDFPDCLEITAVTDLDEIMGVKHREYPIYGLQFHPESILTQSGKEILLNFLKVSL